MLSLQANPSSSPQSHKEGEKAIRSHDSLVSDCVDGARSLQDLIRQFDAKGGAAPRPKPASFKWNQAKEIRKEDSMVRAELRTPEPPVDARSPMKVMMRSF